MDRYKKFNELKKRIKGIKIELVSEKEIKELFKELENLEKSININENTLKNLENEIELK